MKQILKSCTVNVRVNKCHNADQVIFSEFVNVLDAVVNIFNVLGTSSPFEKMIHAKSSQLRKACKEMSTLGFLK